MTVSVDVLSSLPTDLRVGLDVAVVVVMVLACAMVGHSEAAEAIAAKFPLTPVTPEVLPYSEEPFAVVVIEEGVAAVVCAMVLGVFNACVTRNFARWTDFVDP